MAPLAAGFEKRTFTFTMTVETLQVLLAGCLLAMYILAMFSLRRHPLSLGRFIAWGCFALFLPALGPFLVILIRPGGPPRPRLRRFNRR